MSKVATIEKISKIRKHPNADTLDLLTVGGWEVVAKQGQYKEGDLCVYIAPDSVVEDRPIYEFLRNENFRIKQIKLRGEVSNGLCLPIREAIPDVMEITGLLYCSQKKDNGYTLTPLFEGADVAELVGAKHYEKPVPACLVGKVRSTFPSFMRKTDEDNLRSNIKALEELQGKEIYITTKYDGSSGTYYKKGEQFGVCSRNMDLLPEENNTFWKIAEKYELEKKIKAFASPFNVDVCLQGDVYGDGIQGNKLGIKGIDFAAFNLFNITTQKYEDLDVLSSFCTCFSIPMVPVIYRGICNFTLADLIKMANELRYPNGSPAEGIVVRPTQETQSQALKGRLSVKIISEVFAGKYGE